MQSLVAAVVACALGTLAEIPTWDASCVGCPLRSLADHKVESAGGFLATTLTVDVITLKTPNTTFKTRAYNGTLAHSKLTSHFGAIDATDLAHMNSFSVLPLANTANSASRVPAQ